MISADGQCGKATAIKICKCAYSLNAVRNVKLYKIFAVCKCISSDAGNAFLDPDLCYLVAVSIPGDFFLILPFIHGSLSCDLEKSVFIKAPGYGILLCSA